MTLVARLENWRKTLTDGHVQDGEPPPTEEDVLAQFLYSAVDACFEEGSVVNALLDQDGRDYEHVLNAWVDTYAAALDDR